MRDPIKRNCVILHSKRHFDPECNTELDESSAARIAREIYVAATMKGTHNVFYYDLFDTSEWVKRPVDVLISLVDNRNLALWFFRPEKSFVIAVNRHPLNRLELLDQAMKCGIPVDALTASDGFLQSYRKLANATEVACVGNDYVADTYRLHIDSSKVVNSYYNSNFFDENHLSNENIELKEIRVMVLASSIGFRKGADLLIDLAKITKNDNITFDVIGVPESAYWRIRLQEAAKMNKNLLLHGWINNKSEEFNDYLSNSNAAIFLSREEGLLGSLLECITRGTPSFHGFQSGLNPSDNTFDISHLDVSKIRNQLITFLDLTLKEQRILSNKQKVSMINQFNDWEPLHKIISRWMDSPSLRDQSSYRFLSPCFEGIKNLIVIMKRHRYWRIYILRVRILFVRYHFAKLAISYPKIPHIIKRLKIFLEGDPFLRINRDR